MCFVSAGSKCNEINVVNVMKGMGMYSASYSGPVVKQS